MKKYSQVLRMLWKATPPYAQVPVVAWLLVFALNQSLDFGHMLGRSLYHVLH